MNTYRRKPELWLSAAWVPPPGSGNLPLGCILNTVSLLIWYFVFEAFERVISKVGSTWDQIIAYGGSVLGVIFILQGFLSTYKRTKTRQAARKSWLAGCKTSLLTIVDRYEASSWREKRAHRYLGADRYLELQTNPDQIAASPNQATIRAEVSRAAYKRLKDSSTVRIYYQPEAPLTFLLEEEL